MVSPPYSSGTRPYSVSCPRTFVGSAPTLSILFTATTTGTSAAKAWFNASIVCGITVVRSDDQHCDVGRLGATGSHCGEGLVTRGVDEGDLAFFILHLGGDLVGTNGLGYATCLTGHHIGLADCVQQLRLAMINVTHDGDHWRASREILLATGVFSELDVEALQQFAIFVLGRNDLDVVVELSTQYLQSVVAHRLGRGHHLAEMEQHLDEGGGVCTDLLR